MFLGSTTRSEVGQPTSSAKFEITETALTAARSGSHETPICPACGLSEEFKRIYKGLDQCRKCEFVFFRDIERLDFAALYGESYFRGFEYADYLGEQDALRRSMCRHLVQMEKYENLRGNLFEIGCAYGLFLDEAKSRFSSVAGVDISREATTYARQALGIDASDSDFLTMDFGSRRFEAICMWDTIEHVPLPDRFVQKASELLTSDGFLYLTTGDIGSVNARLRGSRWRQIHPPSHLGYFSRSTITLMLSRFGLDVVGIETASYYHTLFNVLRTLELRGGAAATVARVGLRILGEAAAKRLGTWVNLGDIMFVAARRTRSGG
jgi:2-polyprenyl-3-methyl-5-hydroxy-6-metoxy-1,4-benzoquinol methylase